MALPPVKVAEGALTAMAGTVLSTVKVELGAEAGALLPAVSVAVLAAMEMPSVPSPERPVMVTVRVLPAPATVTVVAFAVPVLFSVIFAVARVELLKWVSL